MAGTQRKRSLNINRLFQFLLRAFRRDFRKRIVSLVPEMDAA
jgi:hypothetical protein